MLNRIKSIITVRSPSVFDKIVLSIAIIGTLALIMSNS